LVRADAALNRMKNNLRGIIFPLPARLACGPAPAKEFLLRHATGAECGDPERPDHASGDLHARDVFHRAVFPSLYRTVANKAAEAARQAADTARLGGSIVEGTLTKMRLIAESVGATAKKMEELGKSSDQIGRIIGVID